jgi:predicted permease
MRAVTVYRALLWAYPAPFRREYGREMAGAFGAELADARREAGWRGTAATWARALRDLIPTAIREHRHVLIQDLRHAARILAASPVFTIVAVGSLALGIGANTAIFSLLNNVMVTTLPVRDPQSLVILTDPDASGTAIGSQTGQARSLATYPEYRDLQGATRSFDAIMASTSTLQRGQVRLDGGPFEDFAIRLVSTSYFDALGVPAFIGRTFGGPVEPAEGSAPYAVISYDLWQRRFGGRADVIGRTIGLRDATLQVIGVAPARFFGETVGERPDAWVPLAMQPMVMPGRPWLHDVPGSVEKVMWLHVFGRLKPGVTPEAAQAEANVIFKQGLARYYGVLADPQQREGFLDQKLVVHPAATGASSLRDFADPLYVLLAGAGVVLLIACANLGNLLLARTTARQREVAVRLALGAGRGRLVRQLLTESFCLAAAGGAIGLLTALAMRQGLLRLMPDQIILPPAIDARLLAFVVALTIVTGLVLGLLPALRVTRIPVATGLRDQGRGIAGSAAWLRIGRTVVVGQLALSLPLLVGAGLLVRTLVNLQRVDLGYPKEHLLTFTVDGLPAGYAPARQEAAFAGILARLRALPGVQGVTYSSNGLFGGSDNGDRITVEGYTPKGDNDRGSSYDAVAPGYFSTLGVPIVVGREITEQDRAGSEPVCVINETFARRFFEGRQPIGLHVTQQYAEDRHTYQVVGVVKDSRQNRLRGRIEHRFYTPAAQPASSISSVTFIVRPRGDEGGVASEVRRVIREAEPRMAITRAGPVVERVERRLGQDRMVAQLSIAFGVVAALLTALGLYGILSYGVTRRTHEIGLRKALGAGHGVLMAMILRETGWLVAGGLVAGGGLSYFAARLIASRLFGLTPADPATLAASIAGLTTIAVLAAWLPAWRAARVDPLVALRQE